MPQLRFTQTTFSQDRFRHVRHMEIVPFRLTAKCQPDLSLSVFLERFSVCSSETSCTIRLFQFGGPKPLGTHVDRGSAIITRHSWVLGSTPWLVCSWVLGSHSLAVCSWVLGSHSLAVCSWVLGSQSLAVFLFNFIYSATTLAQVYDIDFVFNRLNVLLSRLGIGVLDLNLVHHLVVICS